MNEKKDNEIKPEEGKDERNTNRISEPGRTPGQAEGTEEDIQEALRQREIRRKEH